MAASCLLCIVLRDCGGFDAGCCQISGRDMKGQDRFAFERSMLEGGYDLIITDSVGDNWKSSSIASLAIIIYCISCVLSSRYTRSNEPHERICSDHSKSIPA